MRRALLLLTVLASVAVAATAARANHQWWTYHWPEGAGGTTMQVVDSASTGWTRHLASSTQAWSASPDVDVVVDDGPASRSERKTCDLVPGAIRVCNASYGRNGWLGLTEIWVDGDHILQARVRLNESYLRRPPYDNGRVRRHVLCQEIGHALGLDHQYATSCMNDRDGLFDRSFTAPNTHDYEELATIYGHADGGSVVSGSDASAQTLVEAKPLRWTFAPPAR